MSHFPPLHPIRRPFHPFSPDMSIEERICLIVTKWHVSGLPPTIYWAHNTTQLMCHSSDGITLFIPENEVYDLPASPKEGSTIQSKRGFMVKRDVTPPLIEKVIYLTPTEEPSYRELGQKELEGRVRTPSPLYRETSPLIEPSPDWALYIDGNPILVYRDKGQVDGFVYGNRIQHLEETETIRANFRSIAFEMVSAVKFLHDKEQVHTDISLENFLIVDREGGRKGAQIIDIYHVTTATSELIQRDLLYLGVALLKHYRLHHHTSLSFEALIAPLINQSAELITREKIERWDDEDWILLQRGAPPPLPINLAEILATLSRIT
jgi:hypothetical protein